MSASQFVSYARKFLIGVAGALAITVVALADNTISPVEWVQIAIGFLTAIGIFYVPNTPNK